MSSKKYIKLSTGEEILAVYMKPSDGFFHLKNPIQISHVIEKNEEGVRLQNGYLIQTIKLFLFPLNMW